MSDKDKKATIEKGTIDDMKILPKKNTLRKDITTHNLADEPDKKEALVKKLRAEQEPKRKVVTKVDSPLVGKNPKVEANATK